MIHPQALHECNTKQDSFYALTQIYGFGCQVATFVKGRFIKCGKPVTEQHHVFVRDRKAARPWCHHPVLLQLSCHACNTGIQKPADSDMNTLAYLAEVLTRYPDLFAKVWADCPVKEFGPRYRKVNNWYQDYLAGGVDYMLRENLVERMTENV